MNIKDIEEFSEYFSTRKTNQFKNTDEFIEWIQISSKEKVKELLIKHGFEFDE